MLRIDFVWSAGLSKTPLGWNSDFPHVPNKMSTRSDTACSGCPMTGVHKTCTSAAPSERPADSELISLSQMQSFQWGLVRRNLDAEGVKGSLGDGWDQTGGIFLARDTDNYIVMTSWFLHSVDPSDPYVITLERISGQDPREVLFNSYDFASPDDGTGLTRVPAENHCSVTPGHAVLRLSSNSILAHKAWPVVVEIISQDHANSLLTVRVDKSCAEALTHYDSEDTSAIVVTCHQYCSPEIWQHIIKPDYFYGERKTLLMDAGDVPTSPIDGVYTLEASAPVMDENGFDELDPTFTFEGRRIDDSTWETVPQHTQRLFVIPTKAYIAFKDLKPAEGVSSITLVDDLTVTYSAFRITYYKLTDGTSGSCRIVGFSRCRRSLPANGAGVENYGPGDGIGDDYYCSRRRYDSDPTNIDLSDEDEPADGIRETSTPWQASASGVSRYPSNGLCLQKNCCDFWESATRLDDRDAPWQYEQMISRVFHEAAGAVNHRAYKPDTLSPTWQVERILHPSIAYLAGYVSLETATGIHPQASFTGNGTWGWPEEVLDYPTTGESSLVVHLGAFQDFDVSDPTTQADGQIPARATGFKTKRDPLDQGLTIDDQDCEMMGVGVERDTGTLVGYGPARASLAVTAQRLVFAPNIDATLTDTVISKAWATFQRFSDSSDAELRLIPLRQELKTPETIGSRTLADTPTVPVSGVTELEFNNVTHSYGSPSGGVDAVVSWLGGGDPATIPPPPQREINNYHEPTKTTGGKNRAVTRGDALQVEIDSETRTFVVISTTAHGGSSAGTWDGTTPLDSYSVDGDYTNYGQLRDICTVHDPEGALVGLAADTSVTFVKNAVVMMPGAVLEWTEYQSDNWQPVEGATHWYGDGLWYIPDSWFADKPDTICFSANNCEWMDHRGIVPATLYNKLESMLGTIDTVSCFMSSHPTGDFNFSREVSQWWEWNQELEGCGEVHDEGPVTTFDDTAVSNSFLIESGEVDGNRTTSRVSLSITSTPVGSPFSMLFFPDGTQILEAWAQISGGSVTRTITYGDGSPPDTSVGDIACFFVGFSSPASFDIIGTVAGGGNGSHVIPFTDIARAMLSHRSTGQYPYGYGTLFSPLGLDDTASSLEDWLPGEGPSHVEQVQEGFPCEGSDRHRYDAGDQDLLQWENITIQSVAMRILYPDSDKARTLVMPRWPSMADAVPAGMKMYEDGTTAPL